MNNYNSLMLLMCIHELLCYSVTHDLFFNSCNAGIVILQIFNGEFTVFVSKDLLIKLQATYLNTTCVGLVWYRNHSHIFVLTFHMYRYFRVSVQQKVWCKACLQKWKWKNKWLTNVFVTVHLNGRMCIYCLLYMRSIEF